MHEYLIFGLFIFIFYWAIVAVLKQKGILTRYNISAYGPLLLIRTRRGLGFLERLAWFKRFWKIFASIGSVLVFVSMTLMLILVIGSNYVLLTEKPVTMPELREPRNWLLIPGLNEFIPLLGWIGLIVAIIVHEFSHAILCIVEKVKVKSMGLLVTLVPIGAFTEPDNEQLFGVKDKKEGVGEKKEKGIKVASPLQRTRILSAGVTGNFFVAFLAFLLFFTIVGNMQPINDKTLFVYDIANGSLAERIGIKPGMLIIDVNHKRVGSIEELNERLEANNDIIIGVFDNKGEGREIVVRGEEIKEGVMIVGVIEGFAASKAGIKEGMRIVRINDEEIRGYRDFQDFMNHTTPGEVIEIYTEKEVFNVTLGRYPHGEKGFLGVYYANCPLGMIVGEFPTNKYLTYLRSIPSSLISLRGWLSLMVIPFYPMPYGFSGFNPLLSNLFEPIGPVAPLGKAIFFIADLLFWTGWINFYVALFNCLPAIPFDGGYIFRDATNQVLKAIIRVERIKERVLSAIITIVTAFVFFSLIFTLTALYIT
ncbi:MAG: site-2 protease family protein [Candidatus Methanospirareceae archaeon]